MSIPSSPEPRQPVSGPLLSPPPSGTAILSVSQGRGFGAERVLIELLAGWQAAGHAPLQVIAPRDSSVLEAARKRGHRTMVYPATRDAISRNLPAAWRVSSSLSGVRHLHAWTARAFDPGRLLARRLKVPCSATLHDHPRAAFHGKTRRWIIQHLGARMQPLVCVSDALTQACLAAGYPEACLQTIQNGLPDLTSPPPPRLRKGPPLRIAFLGMYASWKGFDLVKQWIRRSPENSFAWNLYGRPLPRYLDELEQLKRSDVEVKGHGPIEDILQSNDLLLHCSTSFDPFPTVLLEAARAGVPAIAGNLGGAAEIIDHRKTGWLFDPQNPEEGWALLASLQRDPGPLEGVGTKARKRYEDFFMIDHMLHKYRSLWA